jgi:hypothetical protein
VVCRMVCVPSEQQEARPEQSRPKQGEVREVVSHTVGTAGRANPTNSLGTGATCYRFNDIPKYTGHAVFDRTRRTLQGFEPTPLDLPMPQHEREHYR